MLTDAQCRNAVCPTDKKRLRLSDSGGLYLEVSPSGSKRWFWKFRKANSDSRLALGSYPAVSLVAARRARDAARLQRAEGTDPAQARKLEKLKAVNPKHLGAWGIYAGSDFDIESAVRQARAEIGEPDLDRISTLSDLQPVLAKRLYQETGTMRWFNRALARLDGIEQLAENYKHKPGSVGTFVMCLPSLGTRTKSAEHRVRHASTAASDTLLLGTPKNAERIAELSLELAAAERVSKTHPELHGDPVARRELVGRIETVRSSLEEELVDAFSTCLWYRQGISVNPKHDKPLTVLASEIARDVYRKTPPIFSELINREEPSSNSVKARKDLLYRMVSHTSQERLGYEGFPADAGLYFTILNNPGLHRHASSRPVGESFPCRHCW